MRSDPAPHAAAAEPSRILLVRLREIGDVVFTTPAIRAIRARLPRAHVAYVVEPAAAPVVARNPCLDEVIVAPRAHLAADLALGRRLRAGRYDLAIDFHGGPRASLLTWLSGAPVRVGYDVPGRAWMYTRRVARPRELRPRHAVENQWDLIEAAGLGAGGEAPRYSTEMPVDPAAAAAIERRLLAEDIGPSARIVVVHVSAGNPFRRWPPQAFAALAAELVATQADVHLFATSGPSERGGAARVVEAAHARVPVPAGRRIHLADELSLAELRALIERASLFVGGDSGPMHIASTSRVPIVGLYGPTLPVRSRPWRNAALATESVEAGDLPCRPCDQRVCAPGDFRCLTGISVEAVAEAARRALARSGSQVA